MLCTVAELCHLETGLVLRIRFYPRIHSDARITAAVQGAEEGDKAGNPFIPLLVNFGLAAAVFRPFPLGAAEKRHADKVLPVCWKCLMAQQRAVFWLHSMSMSSAAGRCFCVSRTPSDWGGHLVLHHMGRAVLGFLERSSRNLLSVWSIGARLVSSCSETHGLFWVVWGLFSLLSNTDYPGKRFSKSK